MGSCAAANAENIAAVETKSVTLAILFAIRGCSGSPQSGFSVSSTRWSVELADEEERYEEGKKVAVADDDEDESDKDIAGLKDKVLAKEEEAGNGGAHDIEGAAEERDKDAAYDKEEAGEEMDKVEDVERSKGRALGVETKRGGDEESGKGDEEGAALRFLHPVL